MPKRFSRHAVQLVVFFIFYPRNDDSYGVRLHGARHGRGPVPLFPHSNEARRTRTKLEE